VVSPQEEASFKAALDSIVIENALSPREFPPMIWVLPLSPVQRETALADAADRWGLSTPRRFVRG
jgi:hypothetical protein